MDEFVREHIALIGITGLLDTSSISAIAETISSNHRTRQAGNQGETQSWEGDILGFEPPRSKRVIWKPRLFHATLCAFLVQYNIAENNEKGMMVFRVRPGMQELAAKRDLITSLNARQTNRVIAGS